MTLISLLLACSTPTDTGSEEGEAAEAAVPTSSPFETCDPGQIDKLAGKYGFQLVFEPCGTNSFLDFAWSTDGHSFYYRRGMTHRVVDAASSKRTEQNVPTSIPVGSVAWLGATRLALPLGPTVGLAGGPFRIAVWDTKSQALAYLDLPSDLSDPTDLARGAGPDEVLFSAARDGKRTLFRLDLRSQEVTEPFQWLLPFDTVSYTAAGNAVVAGVGETVTLYDATTGKVRGLWAPATRGAMHPGGRWLVLEHIGEAVSVFHPLGVEELPEADRKAAIEAAERKADEQPADYPRKVRPPMLSFVDATTGKRFLITAVQGSQFEWYETQDYYGSFTSWGFEQHQFRRNVVLGDLAKWMLNAEQGVPQLGVRSVSPAPPPEGSPASSPSSPAPAEGGAAPAEGSASGG